MPLFAPEAVKHEKMQKQRKITRIQRISGDFLVETTELEGVAAYVTGCFAVVFGAMKSTQNLL